jgi:hypothetical protein
MVQFWLEYLPDLINTQNFSFLNNDPQSENYTKVLNIVSLVAIISGISITLLSRNSVYFALAVVVLSVCILINSNKVSTFTDTSLLSNTYDTGVVLTEAISNVPGNINNTVHVSSAMNFNKGDIIAFSVDGDIKETNIVADVKYSPTNSQPFLLLLNDIKGDYSKYTTKILKVSNSSPNIIPPPDGNVSIQKAGSGYTSDQNAMSLARFPETETNGNPYDWNLELATMGPTGMENPYTYQGQPYGNLKCRESSPQNPMGVIEVPEYDSAPTMYGTCNEGNLNGDGVLNDTAMTRNQEATVSQRVDDLLFHKGNSQWHYSPVSVDTLPNDQEAFSHFCYRNPTNLVNPKYASIFVNDPEKLKLVSRLARATGTENGGGGGGH